MIHLGDITKINGGAIPPVDVIIGGSPCQDLSIAGNRKGLQGERSGLFMEQIRIIKEMRNTYGTDYPRFMVWENVPGALSSNGGEDFRAVLEETVRIVEPVAIIPRPEKWRTSGTIMGNGWSLSWRILDAQFWGVPQRRRRISLIADFGGNAAPEILFVRKGLSGNITESRTKGQGASADAERGTGEADEGITYCLQGNGIDRAETAGCNGKGWTEDVSYTHNTIDRPAVCAVDAYNHTVTGETAVTLTAASGSSPTHSGPMVCCIEPGAIARDMGNRIWEEVSPTLRADMGDNQPAVICLNDQGGSVIDFDEDAQTAPTLRAEMHGNIPAVLPFNTTQITSKQNGNNPKYGDPCHTLNATDHPPAIIFDTPLVMAHGQANAEIFRDLCPTLNCDHEQPILAAFPDPANTLLAKANMSFRNDQDTLIAAVDCRNGAENPDVNGTLQAKSSGGTSYNLQNTVRINQAVRRLTPLECERLQGYPDEWTDIGEWTDSKGKKRQTTDGVRYKALGNSIALPPWKWVLKRICSIYERDAAMGSLFDGIGGFPLIWEQLNGKGSCLWASEIEEFCIAVTGKRFGS